MNKKQCKKCGFEYEYEAFANLIAFCPNCNEYDYLSCEYGFGPVTPCRIYHGNKVVGMVTYDDDSEQVYRIDSEVFNLHKVLEKRYLEALYEAMISYSVSRCIKYVGMYIIPLHIVKALRTGICAENVSVQMGI